MNGDIERVLTALNAAGVRYLVVGGVAVVLHGHLRATYDLDLVLHLEAKNLSAALSVLEDLGLKPAVPAAIRDFAEPGQRQKWAREKNMLAFPLWNPDNPTQKIDLLIEEPFPFDEALSRSTPIELGATVVPVIALDDLLAMKRRSGRPHDVADIAALERLRERLGPGS